MNQRTAAGGLLLVGIFMATLWVPAIPAGADTAPEKFEAVLGPFPIDDNPCTGESGLTLTAYVDVTFHLFTDEAGNDHFISVWNGTAVTSDGYRGPVQFTNIGQPDAKDFAFRFTTRLTDGTNSYVVVGTSNGLIVDRCLGPSPSEELIFAVAYTDVDVDDGGYNPAVDRLIAKLVDGNYDGVPSPGDLVIAGEYPKDFEATTFGRFTTQQHTVTGVFVQSAEHCWVESSSGAFHWNDQDRFLESYIEAGLPLFGPTSVITDGFETAADDHMKLDAASPSRPMDTFTIHGFVSTDQPFVDIDLNCQ